MKACNVCGKEFEESELILQKTDDGEEYYICNKCETEGVRVEGTVEYYICKRCGYPHQKDEFNRKCKFCENSNGFEKLELTAVEAELLDIEPQKLYKEKLGDEQAKKIAEWIESPERKEVGVRHKRDRLIDTSSLFGIIIGYIMVDIGIRTYAPNKPLFLALMATTVLTLLASPIFKKIDRKPRTKPLPLWIPYVWLGILVDIYIILIKILS